MRSSKWCPEVPAKAGRARRPVVAAVVAAALLALTGCAATPKGGAPAAGTTVAASTAGVVQSIREVKEPGKFGALLGTVGGAAIGGLAGANIGGGSGRIVASSVLSVITGSLGASVGRMFGTHTRYDVVVRHDDGIDRTYALDDLHGLKPGVAVSVDAGGKVAATP
jgi:outer membrane lipoprotein SlyB